MSIVTPWSTTVQSASPEASGAKLSRVADPGKDRYASWKIVFERARPVDVSQDGRAVAHADGETRSDASPTHANSVTVGRGLPVGDAPIQAHMPSITLAVASPLAAMGSSGAASNDSRWFAAAQTSGAAISAAATQALPRSDRSLPPVQSAPSAASVDLWSSTTPQYPAADSVSVFVHGETVEIVVRDAGISDQQALQAAFATALDLAGRRDALRELTLNGRTLYRRQDDSARAPPQQPAALAFAC